MLFATLFRSQMKCELRWTPDRFRFFESLGFPPMYSSKNCVPYTPSPCLTTSSELKMVVLIPDNEKEEKVPIFSRRGKKKRKNEENERPPNWGFLIKGKTFAIIYQKLNIFTLKRIFAFFNFEMYTKVWKYSVDLILITNMDYRLSKWKEAPSHVVHDVFSSPFRQILSNAHWIM